MSRGGVYRQRWIRPPVAIARRSLGILSFSTGAVTISAVLATATALSDIATVTTGVLVSGLLATATALSHTAKNITPIAALVATATAKSDIAVITLGVSISGLISTATALSYNAIIDLGDRTAGGIIGALRFLAGSGGIIPSKSGPIN